MTWLPIVPSVELFLTHYRFGENYKNNTVLVDPSYKIIAFFDNDEWETDVIMTDIPNKELFIVANWVPKKIKKHIKYVPMNRDTEFPKIANTKWDKKALYEEVNNRIEKYNKSYFKGLVF